jgi:hypothetical protein
MPGEGVLPEYLDDDDWSDEQVDDDRERLEKARNLGGERGGRIDLHSAEAGAGKTFPSPSIDFFLTGDDSTSLLLL